MKLETPSARQHRELILKRLIRRTAKERAERREAKRDVLAYMERTMTRPAPFGWERID